MNKDGYIQDIQKENRAIAESVVSSEVYYHRGAVSAYLCCAASDRDVSVRDFAEIMAVYQKTDRVFMDWIKEHLS